MYLTLSYWTVSYRFDVMMINLQFAWQNTSEKLVYQGSASHAWQRFFIIKSLYSCYICNSPNRIPDIFVFFIITCRLRFCVNKLASEELRIQVYSVHVGCFREQGRVQFIVDPFRFSAISPLYITKLGFCAPESTGKQVQHRLYYSSVCFGIL